MLNLKKDVRRSFTFRLPDELYEPFAAFMVENNIDAPAQAVRDLLTRALSADQFTAAQKAVLRRLEAKVGKMLHDQATENTASIVARMRAMEPMLIVSAESVDAPAPAPAPISSQFSQGLPVHPLTPPNGGLP